MCKPVIFTLLLCMQFCLSDCNHGKGLAVLHPVYYRHICKDGLSKFVRFAVRVWGLWQTSSRSWDCLSPCKSWAWLPIKPRRFGRFRRLLKWAIP